MKFKGITKLVLAGTALAATAATLTTATYAWYVTNSSVDVTNISGQVASQSEGSLYIAKDQISESAHSPQKYRNDLTFAAGSSAADLDTGKYYAQDLDPQSKTASDVFSYERATAYAANTTYYNPSTGNALDTQPTSESNFTTTAYYTRTQIANAGDFVDDKGKAITGGGNFITFNYWLKSNSNSNLQIKFMVDNITSGALNSQIAMTDENSSLPTGVNQGDTFTADAVHALRMSVTKTVYDLTKAHYEAATGNAVDGVTYYADANGTALDPQPTVGDDVSDKFVYVPAAYTVATTGQDATPTHIYQVDKIALNADGSAGYTTATSTAVTANSKTFVADNGDANKYYYALTDDAPFNTGASGASTDGDSGETSWATYSLAAEKDTLFTFQIWLEGSDSGCWDSCRGQSFSFAFEISLVAQSNQQQNP